MPEPDREHFITTQPGKGLYTLFVLLFNITQAPLWGIYYILPFLRPHSSWSWRQAFRMKIVRTFLGWSSTVEMLTPFDLKPGAEKDQWTLVNPAPSKYFVGVTKTDSKIQPVKTGGTWYPAKPKSGEKLTNVVLHFHGGAFVIGDGRKKDCGFLADSILRSGADVQYVFCPQYRLASNAGGRFPAALQDAVSAYVYLLDTYKVDPQDITVSGDSAGGNLILALMRYIADHGKQLSLPNPGCALLWSPWVDPKGSTDRERFFTSPNLRTDYLNPDFGSWGARCYMPIKSTHETDVYIDFLHNAYVTPVPLHFCIGEAEMLMPDDTETYEAFKKLNPKSKIEADFEPYSPHDIILVGDKTAFVNEAREAARKSGKFLKAVRAAR